MLNRNNLRWMDNAIRMDNNRLTKKIAYGELVEGHRTVSRQLGGYQDNVMSKLKACRILVGSLEQLTADRNEWRETYRKGLASFDEERIVWLCEQRDKRHQAPS